MSLESVVCGELFEPIIILANQRHVFHKLAGSSIALVIDALFKSETYICDTRKG